MAFIYTFWWKGIAFNLHVHTHGKHFYTHGKHFYLHNNYPNPFGQKEKKKNSPNKQRIRKPNTFQTYIWPQLKNVQTKIRHELFHSHASKGIESFCFFLDLYIFLTVRTKSVVYTLYKNQTTNKYILILHLNM